MVSVVPELPFHVHGRVVGREENGGGTHGSKVHLDALAGNFEEGGNTYLGQLGN
jgi:hypothetical protein